MADLCIRNTDFFCIKELVSLLVSTGCLKFGQFTLKSGASSPYYIDLRESTMHMPLFKQIVNAIKYLITRTRESIDNVAIVGIPYGVVPIAAVVAYELGVPYHPVRKEVKEYGNESDFNQLKDHEYILIEDVMSTGSSILEIVEKLKGRKISDVMVVVDREAGGEANLLAACPNIELRSIFTASELLKFHKELFQ